MKNNRMFFQSKYFRWLTLCYSSFDLCEIYLYEGEGFCCRKIRGRKLNSPKKNNNFLAKKYSTNRGVGQVHKRFKYIYLPFYLLAIFLLIRESSKKNWNHFTYHHKISQNLITYQINIIKEVWTLNQKFFNRLFSWYYFSLFSPLYTKEEKITYHLVQ